MKAKDYYIKYKGYFFLDTIELSAAGKKIRVVTPLLGTELLARTIVDEFIWEARQMSESRRAEGLDSCAQVMREQNLKWKALCRIFVKHYGYSPLRINDFWYYVEQFTKK